jgi:hypothetical protein
MQLVAVSLLSLLMASFNGITPTQEKGIEASYGDEKVQLVLEDDFSFHYKDLCNSKKIDVSGTYEIDGNKVHLSATDKSASFHDTWKLLNNQQVAKSRKGLLFMRLCEM